MTINQATRAAGICYETYRRWREEDSRVAKMAEEFRHIIGANFEAKLQQSDHPACIIFGLKNILPEQYKPDTAIQIDMSRQNVTQFLNLEIPNPTPAIDISSVSEVSEISAADMPAGNIGALPELPNAKKENSDEESAE